MAKIKCNACNTINNVSNDIDSFYCSNCGKKVKVPHKEAKKVNKLVIIMGIIIVILLLVILFLLFGKDKLKKAKEVPQEETIKEVENVVMNIKESYKINDEFTLNATIYPLDATNKTLIWTVYDDDKGIEETLEGDTYKFTKGGDYSICATSSNGKRWCSYISVDKPCLSTYTFTYDGGTPDVINVGASRDICPGKYRVTAHSVNNSSCPMIVFNNGSTSETMVICFNDALNQNGKTHVLGKDGSVEVDAGYTKVVFKKVK